jgi:integrase/recombinase XerD
LIVRFGKYDKRREIAIPERVIADLRDYLINERHSYFKKKNNIPNAAFLLNKKGARMTGAYVNERLKELILITNDTTIINKEISLHNLRHSIATHLLDNGASMEYIQRFLGHADLDTVHIYTKRRKYKQLQITR